MTWIQQLRAKIGCFRKVSVSLLALYSASTKTIKNRLTNARCPMVTLPNAAEHLWNISTSWRLAVSKCDRHGFWDILRHPGITRSSRMLPWKTVNSDVWPICSDCFQTMFAVCRWSCWEQVSMARKWDAPKDHRWKDIIHQNLWIVHPVAFSFESNPMVFGALTLLFIAQSMLKAGTTSCSGVEFSGTRCEVGPRL